MQCNFKISSIVFLVFASSILIAKPRVKKVGNVAVILQQNPFDIVAVGDHKKLQLWLKYKFAKKKSLMQRVLLVKPNSQLDTVNEHGRTLLMEVARLGNKKMANSLLQYGASVCIIDVHGKTALDYAVEIRKNSVIYKLLSYGAKTNNSENLAYLTHLVGKQVLWAELLLIGYFAAVIAICSTI